MSRSSLKYARVERERRWLLTEVPDLPDGGEMLAITDRYLAGSRLRLREVVMPDAAVIRKLGQKIRLGEDAAEIACTSVYLDDDEWRLLAGLPGDELRKERWRLPVPGPAVNVDVFAGHCEGLVLAELDRGDGPDLGLPDWCNPVAEVTEDEAFTGGALAKASRAEVIAALRRYS